MSDVKLRKEAIDLGILVRDAEPMVAFYRDVIGLDYINEQPVGTGGVMHRLAVGASVLKLVVPAAQPPAESPRGVRSATGIRYFSILVDNLEDIHRRCEAAGCEFHMPLKEFQPGQWYFQVYDPEGNVVALVNGDD